MNYDSQQFLQKPNGHVQKHGRVSFKYILIPIFRDITKFYFSEV